MTKINDYSFTVNTGKTYIFRGYLTDNMLTRIEVLDTNYLPISEQELLTYKLSDSDAQRIYNNIINK